MMKTSIVYLTTPLYPDDIVGILPQINKLRGEVLSIDKSLVDFLARAYAIDNKWHDFSPERHLRLPLHKVDYVIDEG